MEYFKGTCKVIGLKQTDKAEAKIIKKKPRKDKSNIPKHII